MDNLQQTLLRRNMPCAKAPYPEIDMRYAEETPGPFHVTLHDGVVIEIAHIDGGGFPLGEFKDEIVDCGGDGGYEVLGEYPDGQFAIIPQSQIKRVTVIATGEEVEFGNYCFPGHPRYQCDL